MQPLWSDNLAPRSLPEVLASKAENSDWSRSLRKQLAVLLDNRLADRISQEEYAADRARYKEDTAECKRRQTLLENEIVNRGRPFRTVVQTPPQ